MAAGTGAEKSEEDRAREYAQQFRRTANTVLAPVYAPLAQQIVDDYSLADKQGIGIDLGSGPGNLVIELSRRTGKMKWINADINPHFFLPFLKTADEAGLRRGDVIVEVNRERVGDLASYRKALRASGKGKTVLLLVRRGENTIFVAMKP